MAVTAVPMATKQAEENKKHAATVNTTANTANAAQPDNTAVQAQTKPASAPVSAPVQSAQISPPVQSAQVPAYDAAAQRELLNQWQSAATQQAQGQIDYATQQGVQELQRAQEEAQSQYKEQAESVAKDERQAMDNSALYAETRGDKGGIGQAQYNAIQAAAAQNRHSVQQAQTKLSTDVARQIADLRAQGEFSKADKALEVTQTYLAQLMQLEQYAAEYGMTAAQFQASLDQWQREYDMAMAQYQDSKSQWEQQFDYAKEQDAIANQQWQAQFDEAAKQWAEEMAFAQQQEATANQQWQTQFDEAKNQWQQEMDHSKEQADIANQQWEKEFSAAMDQWAAAHALDKQQMDTANAQWQKEFDLAAEQWAAAHNLDKEQLAAAKDQWEREFAASNDQWKQEMDYTKEQAGIANQQWEQEFAAALDQWQKEYGTSNEQWQAQFDQAVKEYNDSLALTEQNKVASMGEALINAGVMPTEEQLAAMGITQQQAQLMVAAATKPTYTGGSTGGGETSATTAPDLSDLSVSDKVYKNAAAMYDNGSTDEQIWNYLVGTVGEDAAAVYYGFLGLEAPSSKNTGSQTPVKKPTLINKLPTSAVTEKAMNATSSTSKAVDADYDTIVKNQASDVNALGFGPISGAKLRDLVEKGLVSVG